MTVRYNLFWCVGKQVSWSPSIRTLAVLSWNQKPAPAKGRACLDRSGSSNCYESHALPRFRRGHSNPLEVLDGIIMWVQLGKVRYLP